MTFLFWFGLGIGMFLGGSLGVFIMCMLQVSKTGRKGQEHGKNDIHD